MIIIHSNNDQEVCLPIIDEGHDLIKFKSNKDVHLTFEFPFSIGKIYPELRKDAAPKEHVLIFKNVNFKEFDVCEVRFDHGEGRKAIGYLFNPTMLLDPDSNYIYKGNKFLTSILFRGVLVAINDAASLKSLPQTLGRDIEFSFKDLFPDDIVIGVFPFTLNPVFDEGFFNQLLLQLNPYGFYYLSEFTGHTFTPVNDLYRKEKYESLISNDYKKVILIDKLSASVRNNRYSQSYITQLIHSRENEISRFYQLYGLIEIFKDLALKKEVQEKVCQLASEDTISGYKIGNTVKEISSDAYVVEKLFTKYSSLSPDFMYTGAYRIYAFLEKCREESEIKKLNKFPQLLYYLRNILVHDIQFLFAHERIRSSDLRNELHDLVKYLEIIILELLCAVSLD